MTTNAPTEDRPLTVRQIQTLSSADQLAEFFTYLGYPENTRVPMTVEALHLLCTGSTVGDIEEITKLT